jgi:hypothetical protein
VAVGRQEFGVSCVQRSDTRGIPSLETIHEVPVRSPDFVN